MQSGDTKAVRSGPWRVTGKVKPESEASNIAHKLKLTLKASPCLGKLPSPTLASRRSVAQNRCPLR